MYYRPQNNKSSGTVLNIDSYTHTKSKETNRYNTEEKVMSCCRWASQRVYSKRIAGVAV